MDNSCLSFSLCLHKEPIFDQLFIRKRPSVAEIFKCLRIIFFTITIRSYHIHPLIGMCWSGWNVFLNFRHFSQTFPIFLLWPIPVLDWIIDKGEQVANFQCGWRIKDLPHCFFWRRTGSSIDNLSSKAKNFLEFKIKEGLSPKLFFPCLENGDIRTSPVL